MVQYIQISKSNLKYEQMGEKSTLSPHYMQKSPLKMSTPIHDEISEDIRVQRTYLNIIKAIYTKSIATIKLNDEMLKTTLLKTGTGQGCILSP